MSGTIRVLGLFGFLILTVACATRDDLPVPGEQWARVAPERFLSGNPNAIAEFNATVSAGNTHSMMIVQGGRVVYDYGDLAQTDGTYIASVRKSLLSMLYGDWVRDGTIDLDATLISLGVDDIEGLTGAERAATVRDLISARSGIYHPASNFSGVTAEGPERGEHRAGDYFWYNNWDFNAAGGIFEQLTGTNIYAAFESQIARRIGLQDFDLPQHLETGKSGNLERSMFPAYHFYLSTRDMARLGLLMLRNGRWQGRQIVPLDWVSDSTAVTTRNADMNPAGYRESGFGYGYMWWVFDDESLPPAYHGGFAARGHFGQYIVVLPAVDTVVAHKTLPVDYETQAEYEAVNVTWAEMKVILDRALGEHSPK
jgi:CubicO group peptidase (beta-lactamase class C family)